MERIKVGVYDNSTDWGIVGQATTRKGALRIGRIWARDHSIQKDYTGYGPKIKLRYADGRDEIVSAW